MDYKGIMFDMDNTILKSNIDFKKMKEDCRDILIANNVQKSRRIDDQWTPSQLIELAKEYERVIGDQNKLVERMLNIATNCETEGMKDAVLENGALLVLSKLSRVKTMVIVTNNATVAAKEALAKTEVIDYFDDIFGREKFPALKPSSESINAVLDKYPNTSFKDWVMVGDSWIDGKAAEGANVDFIAYRIPKEELDEHQIQPIKVIYHLDELLT